MIIKVSILVREWSVGRWEEGEQVSLVEELGAAIHSCKESDGMGVVKFNFLHHHGYPLTQNAYPFHRYLHYLSWRV